MKDEYVMDNINKSKEEILSSEDYISNLMNPITHRTLTEELKFCEYAGLL